MSICFETCRRLRSIRLHDPPVIARATDMIDVKILRHETHVVANAIRNKGAKVDLDELVELDRQHSSLLTQVEQLRERRNTLSAAMKTGVKDEAAITQSKVLKQELLGLEEQLKTASTRFLELLRQVPNIPTEDTPIGFSEDDNVVVATWGEPAAFPFKARNHFEIAAHRGWIDKERAAKVAGSRFAYLTGDLVKLQFALIAWVMDRLTDRAFLEEVIAATGLSIPATPFIPVLPPYFIRTDLYQAMDRLEPADDRYKIENEDVWLQGSAEHVLGSMHADEIMAETALPLRYLGYATSFRREAGSAGKDMEGIIRLHQFDKLEMESFTTADMSHDEHLLMSAIQERIMRELRIPYRKLQKCTFDIGKPNAKGSDIEAWLPGQNRYRETHTADFMTDYQARRLQTRVRLEDGSLELVHTNDATAAALGRMMIAIIENGQQEDQQVAIPVVLQPYMGGRSLL
jgi:seryl-tRNA synthetase